MKRVYYTDSIVEAFITLVSWRTLLTMGCLIFICGLCGLTWLLLILFRSGMAEHIQASSPLFLLAGLPEAVANPRMLSAYWGNLIAGAIIYGGAAWLLSWWLWGRFDDWTGRCR